MLVAQNSLGSVCPVPLTVRGRIGGSVIVRRKTMDPRGVFSSGIERFAAVRVSLMSIAKLTAFIRLANMSSKSMMMVSYFDDGGGFLVCFYCDPQSRQGERELAAVRH